MREITEKFRNDRGRPWKICRQEVSNTHKRTHTQARTLTSLHKHTHTHTHTNTQTHKHTHTHKHTYNHTNTHTHTHTRPRERPSSFDKLHNLFRRSPKKLWMNSFFQNKSIFLNKLLWICTRQFSQRFWKSFAKCSKLFNSNSEILCRSIIVP